MNKKLELYTHLLLVWLLTIPVFVILMCCIKDIESLPMLGIPNELQWIFGCSCICLVDTILISYNLITQRKKKIENRKYNDYKYSDNHFLYLFVFCSLCG